MGSYINIKNTIKLFKRHFFVIIISLLLLLLPFFNTAVKAEDTNLGRATIYYNEACGMCAEYINDELPEILKNQGIEEIVRKDYINDRKNRPEMNKLMDDLAVPFDLQSHIMTFISDKYILGGHIPEHIISDLFNSKNRERFKRIIVYQDKMHGEIENYKVLAIPSYADNYLGEIKTYPINTTVTQYLDYLEENKDNLLSRGSAFKKEALLPVILVSGFLDGLNPCAFAVLLFFIAFLFSIKRTRASIWKMGVVYISAIYLAYLLIGFGLLKAILFTNASHFMAKLGAWLVIGLGVINIINHFFPKFPIKLGIPQASKETLQKWIHKATLPAAFVLGFLVGLCTFPCSGGIYVAVIGLLAVKATYIKGVIYLLIYNFMFVLPLVVVLILSANKYTVDKLTKFEQSKSRALRMLLALVMIALGVMILIWFV